MLGFLFRFCELKELVLSYTITQNDFEKDYAHCPLAAFKYRIFEAFKSTQRPFGPGVLLSLHNSLLHPPPPPSIQRESKNIQPLKEISETIRAGPTSTGHSSTVRSKYHVRPVPALPR